LGNAAGLNSSNAVSLTASGTLRLRGNSTTIGSLSGSAGTVENVSSGAATLTVNEIAPLSTFAGLIQNSTAGGTLARTKTVTGKLQLTGATAYSGGTTVSAGTLVVGHVNALGTGALSINTSGTAKLQVTAPIRLPALTIAGATDAWTG